MSNYDKVIRVRVTEEMKKQFDKTCEAKAINASQWLRNVIQNFIEENKEE